MPTIDLRHDFELLKDVSCEQGLERCEALFGVLPTSSLVGHEPPSRQAFLLKHFLITTIDLATAKAFDDEERKRIEAAAALIGLRPWKGKRKKQRQEKAAQILGVSWEALRRPSMWRPLLDVLARAVDDFLTDKEAVADYDKEARALLQSLSPSRTVSVSIPDESTPTRLHATYVHRPEIEAQFNSLINDSGVKLIVFVGQAGMGKTWLAEELTREPTTGVPAPIIDVSRQEHFSRDLMAAFTLTNAQPPDTPDAAVRLANLACSEHAPPFIVLDNLDSTDDLKALLPRHTKSVIVATTRKEGESPLAYTSIHVDSMERAESSEMVRHLLPTIDDEDTEYLVSAFSDYPLIISHVCGLFPNQQASIRELCEELKGDARRLAGQVQTEDQSILLAILRRLVALVAQRDRASYELLVLTSFIGHRILRPVLLHYFKSFFREGTPTDVRFAYTVGSLKALSLIQIDQSSAPKGHVVIHPFTQRVLMQEFDSRLEETLARLISVSQFVFEPGHRTPQAFKTSSAEEYVEITEELLAHSLMVVIHWIRRQPDYWSWSDEKKLQATRALFERHLKRSPGAGR